MLPATRQRWHSRPYPSRSWYSIRRPRRDARLSWLSSVTLYSEGVYINWFTGGQHGTGGTNSDVDDCVVVLQLRNLQMCEQSSQKLTCHKFPVLTLPISSLTKLQVYYTEAQKPSCQAESKMELTSAVKVTLLAFAAAAPCCGAAAASRQAVDALDNLMPARRSAANPPHAVVEWCDRQTDGLKLNCFLDPASHTMRIVSMNQ